MVIPQGRHRADPLHTARGCGLGLALALLVWAALVIAGQLVLWWLAHGWGHP